MDSFAPQGSRPTTPIPSDIQPQWMEYFTHGIASKYKGSSSFGVNPLKWIEPDNQAKRICGWIAYWPFSAIGLFVADPSMKHDLTTEQTEFLELIAERIAVVEAGVRCHNFIPNLKEQLVRVEEIMNSRHPSLSSFANEAAVTCSNNGIGL